VAPDDVRLRPCRAEDLDDLYRVCLLTADNGEDGTALFRDPRLVGDIYAAPYAILEPSLATVAEDDAGVAGYILGAADTVAFDELLEREWLPGLRQRYPEPSPDGSGELSHQETRALTRIHHPEAYVPDPDFIRSYPAHLHIDLLHRLQGRGVGRRLVETLTASLRAQHCVGLHLNVGAANHRAIAFYQRVGFTEVPAEGRRVFVMDLRPEAGPRVTVPAEG
jgi:ribosomal protein S18 acetylase RimI-like enzyme